MAYLFAEEISGREGDLPLEQSLQPTGAGFLTGSTQEGIAALGDDRLQAAVGDILLGEDDGLLLFVVGGHLFDGEVLADSIIDVSLAHPAHHAVHLYGDADHDRTSSAGVSVFSDSDLAVPWGLAVLGWQCPAMAHPAQPPQQEDFPFFLSRR